MREQAVTVAVVDGLADLARGFLAEGVGPSTDLGEIAMASAERPHAVLLLADIITDEGGACVLGADGPNLSIVLETDQPVIAEGSADAYATAAGSDVSGHSFIAFASGITLYFPAEIDVAVAPPLG
jgi:hypothetical protein